MASRGQQPGVEAAANALQNMALADRPIHPMLRSAQSAPSAPGRPPGPIGGLAARRAAPRLNVNDIAGGMPLQLPSGGGPSNAGLGGGRPNMDDIPRRSPQATWGTPFSNFGKIVYVLISFCLEHRLPAGRDPSGALNFKGKAILHAKGVDFSNGSSFAINMTQLQLEEELGRGNYGTVKKVLHKPTKVYMAMKVRLPENIFFLFILSHRRKSAWSSMTANLTL